ncbi:MAG TPA: SpoIIE family protein phosphatase [Levilinea sp.]|nr:SpoIIE family protein phosphatase [Levilinea sp.]
MTDKKFSRVVIVSDQAIFLRSLTAFVTTHPLFRLVGEARSAAEAIQLCSLSEPDILLFDLHNNWEHARETIQQLHGRWPTMKLVLLVGHLYEGRAREEFQFLTVFYISRDVTEEEIKGAFTQIHHDNCPPGDGQHSAHTSFGHLPQDEDENDGLEMQKLVQEVKFRREEEESRVRELVMAGRIQTDILPEEEPVIPGWEVSAKLEPARETSGDFYDFLPLTDRKWGFVVADVTDKGMGAAIFMALSSTLMRTYANRFPTLPAMALTAVSQRILSDTRGGMFVTSIFGVLEPHTGRFIYANAGHPPAFLVSLQKGKESIDHLRPTGMALGVLQQTRWMQKIIKINPGDFLILYSDGITEAQNTHGVFYEEDRMLDAALSQPGGSAVEIRDAILTDVHRFAGNTLYRDDITLVVVRRNP